ncbi:MAG: DUF488 domain-containing protein [Euryarchaeota archaeon]|nr:DUF488 domain-containing protein [Euryarchaeota archaeon]MDE1836741.1 DUF488 domain-containing protein [Euryarchaeota archaeon]MDE1879759.1 DUF488 domain-containing protein [Euryarchaeota archaeon]MDE2044725.1 DUF488 domain-containing protein [Thermoplasmata archaeon]
MLVLLSTNRIRQVVDEGERPFGRKPGFLQEALCLALGPRGFLYRHFPDLGCSPEEHRAFREEGGADSFRDSYTEHLADSDPSYRDWVRGATAATSVLL